MNELKILIADASSVYKRMFSQAIDESGKGAAVTVVSNSDAALELLSHNNFDIAIVDTEIPGAGVFKLLSEMKAEIPDAYILVTAGPSRSNEKIFKEAMSMGATECMVKPIDDSYGENLIIIKNKIKSVMQEAPVKAPKAQVKPAPEPVDGSLAPELVVIAASTGGPLALEKVFAKLSGDFPVPILLVQHIPASFTENLAGILKSKTGLRIKVAENREVVEAGTVYLAPGGTHMKLSMKNMIMLDDSPPINGVRPAADALLESIADNYKGSGVLAVILTGMGSDGKDGLKKLKDKKDCFCISQSERTCVVYGMPRAVEEAGLADKVLDLDQISSEIAGFSYTSQESR